MRSPRLKSCHDRGWASRWLRSPQRVARPKPRYIRTCCQIELEYEAGHHNRIGVENGQARGGASPRNGADGRIRTGTACATAPSRQRVYQFHHIGNKHLQSALTGIHAHSPEMTTKPPRLLLTFISRFGWNPGIQGRLATSRIPRATAHGTGQFIMRRINCTVDGFTRSRNLARD